MSPADHQNVLETLRDAQRLGFFGAASVASMVEHAGGFVDALAAVPDGARVVDLGSGGGLPGLVIATERPGLSVVLVDRRQKRTDFLERAVRRLSLDTVEVWCRDVRDVVRSVADGAAPRFDAVTARGFGPPDLTLRLAAGLVATHGRIVVSEPPSGDRWSPVLLAELGLDGARAGNVSIFTPRR